MVSIFSSQISGCNTIAGNAASAYATICPFPCQWIYPRTLFPLQIITVYTKVKVSLLIDIADVLRFVHEKTGFLSVFTPLQPLYNKKDLDIDDLIAVILSHGLGIGNHKMAKTSDVSCAILDTASQQYLRLGTLRRSNTKIVDAAAQLDVFSHYTFDTLQTRIMD